MQDLGGLLRTLKNSTGNSDGYLTALEQPLARCSTACADFNALIKSARSLFLIGRASRRIGLSYSIWEKTLSSSIFEQSCSPLLFKARQPQKSIQASSKWWRRKISSKRAWELRERFLTIIIGRGLACSETQSINTWKGFDKGQIVHPRKYHLLDPVPSDIQIIKETNRSHPSSAFEIEPNGEKCAMKLTQDSQRIVET